MRIVTKTLISSCVDVFSMREYLTKQLALGSYCCGISFSCLLYLPVHMAESRLSSRQDSSTLFNHCVFGFGKSKNRASPDELLEYTWCPIYIAYCNPSAHRFTIVIVGGPQLVGTSTAFGSASTESTVSAPFTRGC